MQRYSRNKSASLKYYCRFLICATIVNRVANYFCNFHFHTQNYKSAWQFWIGPKTYFAFRGFVSFVMCLVNS